MVLAIMAVLTSVAAPPLRQLLSRNQLQVAQTDFIAALQHTRGTAITTGRRTLFCPSRDGHRCSEETRWDGGWLIGHDVDRDNQPDNGPLRSGRGYDKISILGDSGTLAAKTRGLQDSLKIVTDQQSAANTRLQNLKDNYTNQFNRLNLTLATMQSRQSYLTQQLAKLSKSS